MMRLIIFSLLLVVCWGLRAQLKSKTLDTTKFPRGHDTKIFSVKEGEDEVGIFGLSQEDFDDLKKKFMEQRKEQAGEEKEENAPTWSDDAAYGLTFLDFPYAIKVLPPVEKKDGSPTGKKRVRVVTKGVVRGELNFATDLCNVLAEMIAEAYDVFNPGPTQMSSKQRMKLLRIQVEGTIGNWYIKGLNHDAKQLAIQYLQEPGKFPDLKTAHQKDGLFYFYDAKSLNAMCKKSYLAKLFEIDELVDEDDKFDYVKLAERFPDVKSSCLANRSPTEIILLAGTNNSHASDLPTITPEIIDEEPDKKDEKGPVKHRTMVTVEDQEEKQFAVVNPPPKPLPNNADKISDQLTDLTRKFLFQAYRILPQPTGSHNMIIIPMVLNSFGMIRVKDEAVIGVTGINYQFYLSYLEADFHSALDVMLVGAEGAVREGKTITIVDFLGSQPVEQGVEVPGKIMGLVSDLVPEAPKRPEEMKITHTMEFNYIDKVTQLGTTKPKGEDGQPASGDVTFDAIVDLMCEYYSLKLTV
eukprot:Platyproteum_vivax@DN5185_c0_g1_i3.p1